MLPHVEIWHTIKIWKNPNTAYHFFTGFLSIHESLWNDVWRQQFIALLEFLEKDSIRKSLSTDSNSLQHTVTAQLVEDEQRVDFTTLKNTNSKISTRTKHHQLLIHVNQNGITIFSKSIQVALWKFMPRLFLSFLLKYNINPWIKYIQVLNSSRLNLI